MRSRTRRASTGAAPPLETAITSGERSTIAGTMKLERSASSTTLTRTLRARAAVGDARVDGGVVRGGDHQHDPVELRSSNSRREPATLRPRRAAAVASWPAGAGREAATRNHSCDVRRDHSHVGARLEQQPHLALGHLAAADDEHAAAAQVREQREVAHRAQPSSPCRPHSRFRPKKRVASGSPASASVRVVCQSPIET